MNLLPRQQSAGLLAAPYYMAVGSWFARRRTIEVGLVVGAVTAVLSFLVVFMTVREDVAGGMGGTRAVG